jgi:hypothetical protein
MSFVLNIPSTFKTSTIPSIFGDNILTGNQTLNGNLKVNQSMTLGSGIMSDSSYESMEITQTLHVDEHSIFNRAIVEQSMNVVSSSQLDNVIASNMELTNLNISSEGESEIVAIIRDENIYINSLYTQDISFSNIYILLYNLSLSDSSLSDILSSNYHIVLIDIDEDDDENSYTYISLYDLSFSNYSLYDISLSTFTIESIEISHLLSDCLLYDASLTTLEVTNIDICGHLHVPDISFSNIEVEKLILSDLSVNNATIANLSVNSVELETTSLNNRFSILANEVSQVFSGQSSVLYAFMAKGSSNYSISSGTIIPFVTNVSGCFETELSDFNNYSYTMDGSSSGIWHFGVHGHCINTSTTDLRLGIFRNDELIIQSQITQQNIHIHSTFYCETNDVIQVKCTMGTGYIDLSNSCFFGYKYNPSNNNIEQNTNIIINSLDMSHNENVTIEQGHLLLESGNLEINQLNSGNIKVDSGNIELDSGNIYANQLDVSNIITTQLLGNMDLCGNLSIQSSDYSISNEHLMFDTIVIRRVTSGDNRWIGINEVQLWINNTNVMPGLVLDSFDKNQDVALEDISNIPFFIDWSTKTCDAYHSAHYPHNIANENIDSTAYWGIRDAISSISQYNIYDVNVGLYVPLTSILNVNDVQSLVIYSRVGHESMFTGAIIEFYNRSIDPTLNTPIISTPEIISDSNTNRFDFPSLYTYNSFVSSASTDYIIDSANSAVYNVVSKKIVNSSNVMSSIKSTHENDLSFDTIVIRRPTGYSGDGSYYINLRELQMWIDNSNVLLNNTGSGNNTENRPYDDISNQTTFMFWDTKYSDTHYSSASGNQASNTHDNIISTSSFHNVGDVHSNLSSNSSILTLYVPLNTQYNINSIQSFVYYNRPDSSRTQGLAIELYNRYNDPSLNVILASTKIISETANVYRFDFPSIYTYTKGFAKGDSTYQIASSSHALTEVFSPNDVIGLTLDNCKMGITTFHEQISVEGSIHTNGQVVITNQSTDDNKYFMKYNIDISNHWNIYTNSSDHIYYNYGGNDRGFISSSGSGQMNFTGQHRCFIKGLPTISNEHIGLIVCANQNVYISMNEPRQSIHQDEALPYVSLCTKNNDKTCFGVISHSEDLNKRVDKYGSFASVFPKEKGDTRVYINSVGEGALWIINKNGVLESGDYITTCDISGYGMKQNSDNVKNYSVAKITMDCDFNPLLVPKQVILKDSNGENVLNVHNQMQWTTDISGNIVYEYQYKVKYINQHANEISQQDYIDQSNNAYIAAYVGCTYHCG